MNKIIFLLIAFFFYCFSLLGQEQHWSLQQCIEAGKKNAIAIKIQQLDVKKAQKEHNSVANQFLPTISFTGNQSYNFGSTINPSTNGRESSNIQNDNFNLNAQMSLLDFKSIANARKAKIAIELSKETLKIVENEYQLQILESYYQALFTQELLKIQEEQFKNAEFNLDRVKKEVAIGAKSKSDWYDMQLSFAQEEKRIVETKQLLGIQKKQLFQLINTENSAIEAVVLNDMMETTLSQSMTMDANPKLRYAKLNYESSLADAKMERANNLPSLISFYGFSTFYFKTLNQLNVQTVDFGKQIKDNKNQQLGIQLNVPIFNGFRSSKRFSALKIEAEKTKLVIEQETLKVKNQIDLEHQNKQNYIKLSEKLQEMKGFAETSFRSSQAKFSSGIIDAVVFSTVKNQLLATAYDWLKNQLQVKYVDQKIALLKGEMY
ncbi:TolC family protein [Flavobacterium sp.]|uniref:TolC family protein n=1 Tax=Flavobacterium sp. TaxID=239 RepID=UPI0026093ABD|nr:TolC family protein [Flavobacterium sp.]